MGGLLDKSIIGEAEGPCGLARVFGSKLYWANHGNDTIGVSNTDFATGGVESLVQTGAGEICGVAVDSLRILVTQPLSPSSDPGSGPPPAAPRSRAGPAGYHPAVRHAEGAELRVRHAEGTARVGLTVD